MELLKMYDYKDIKEIVGCANERAYKLISCAQKQFKEEYPNAIIIDNKIPKWYFNERVLGIVERSEKDDKENNKCTL